MTLRTPLIAAASLGTLLLAGCSGAEADGEASPESDASLTVAAAFYPLQYVAEHVGGELVAVEALMPPGVEPHDAELSPAVVRSLQTMDTVLYLSEFQPAVDDAIATTDARALDAHHIVDEHAAAHEDEGHEDEVHEDEADHADEDGHDHGSSDPHFWTDPTLLAAYAEDVAAEFAELDPAGADTYAANAEALVAELTALDEDFQAGLASCERDDIFVSHEAFGYLAERYDLHQEGVAGLDPEAEPSPARIREIRELVAETGATTVYSESLVDASAIEALAADAGVQTAVLDPVEGVTGDDDYIAVMTRNLDALKDGLGCS
ncbi:metal ABC transporter substrate-binding protein [Demequina sp. NBRC 110056]|uniref:metal ABC transporter substrate-binding protein n=1 Tax=Demequina sp. NBRC 110056 TaxID=1570345 RepID=UPI000A077AA5|nr:metal ABC transporter substrate-binding protein [Demequina sp. NBRC 110056]